MSECTWGKTFNMANFCVDVYVTGLHQHGSLFESLYKVMYVSWELSVFSKENCLSLCIYANKIYPLSILDVPLNQDHWSKARPSGAIRNLLDSGFVIKYVLYHSMLLWYDSFICPKTILCHFSSVEVRVLNEDNALHLGQRLQCDPKTAAENNNMQQQDYSKTSKFIPQESNSLASWFHFLKWVLTYSG